MGIYRKENGNMECYGNNSGQDDASTINITDKNGLVTTAGGQTDEQSLINEISDSIMDGLYKSSSSTTPAISDPELKRSDVASSLVNDPDKIPTAAQVYTLNSDITTIDKDTTSIPGVTFQKIGKVVNISAYGITKANLHNKNIPSRFRPNAEFNNYMYMRSGANAYLGILTVNSYYNFIVSYLSAYPADNTTPADAAVCYFNFTYLAD